MQGKIIVVSMNASLSGLGILHIMNTILLLKNAEKIEDIVPILESIKVVLKDHNLDTPIVMNVIELAETATEKIIEIKDFLVKLRQMAEALMKFISDLNSVISAAVPNIPKIVDLITKGKGVATKFTACVQDGQQILS